MSQVITFFTPREVAERLRIHVHTVYSLCDDGRLPAIRVGSQLRIPADELQDWMERNRQLRARLRSGLGQEGGG